MNPIRSLLLAALLTAPAVARAEAPSEAKYYILLFGGQAEPLRPQTAHTWATFVKALPNPAGGGIILDSFTISWLPVRLPVRPFKLRTSAGRNYGLTETLDLFDKGRSDLGLWGPFEIREEWYRSAAEHKRFLDGGTVRFATLDRGPFLPFSPVRHPDISHCVHAVTRTWEPLRRATNPVIWYGELITRKVAESASEVRLLVNPCATHDWLIPALGVDRYPLVRRRLGEPRLALLR